MHMDDYQLEAPKMTYYARAMSNLTGKILTDWQLYDASIWYYVIIMVENLNILSN